MTAETLSIVFIGLSITSSWGNGHAGTYRGLVRELSRRGHDVVFLERDLPWYAANRDLPRPPFGRTFLYRNLRDLKARFAGMVKGAHLVVVGSHVAEGAAVGRWVLDTALGIRAFYDIDVPHTLAWLARGGVDYLSPDLMGRYDLYLSCTGGPVLERIERDFGARMARVLYGSVDTEVHQPDSVPKRWTLGYLGNCTDDRRAKLDALLVQPAQTLRSERFIVVGPPLPGDPAWPGNVGRINHLPPGEHRGFYCAQRYTLNVTRDEVVRTGWSPGTRLFEAAACGAPVITDWWDGLDTIFVPGREILVVNSSEEVVTILRDLPDERRIEIGAAGRRRVLMAHTAAHRARELESHLAEAVERRRITPTRRNTPILDDDRREDRLLARNWEESPPAHHPAGSSAMP
ncbi:MAG: glycosyltransferase [Alphaproteobacteria bacterium]